MASAIGLLMLVFLPVIGFLYCQYFPFGYRFAGRSRFLIVLARGSRLQIHEIHPAFYLLRALPAILVWWLQACGQTIALPLLPDLPWLHSSLRQGEGRKLESDRRAIYTDRSLLPSR
jgi:hypothetical protein